MGHLEGSLGVIGPKRMPYPFLVSAVDYTAKLLGQMYRIEEKSAARKDFMEQQNNNLKQDKPEHGNNHSHNHSARPHLPDGDGKPGGKGPGPASDGPGGQNVAGQQPVSHKENDRQNNDKATIDDLSSRLDAANDKYLRLMAEFDNFKRRTAKEYQQLSSNRQTKS